MVSSIRAIVRGYADVRMGATICNFASIKKKKKVVSSSFNLSDRKAKIRESTMHKMSEKEKLISIKSKNE